MTPATTYLPPGWRESTLGEVCDVIADGTHYTPSYVENGIPFYSVENVTRDDFANVKYISIAEHQRLIRRCHPRRGDILMTRIGSLGETKLLDWSVDASIYVSLALLRPSRKVDGNYLYAFTKSRTFVKAVEDRSLLWAVPKKINMGDIAHVPVLVPDNPGEQRAIAEVLLTLEEQVAKLERMIAKKQAIKQGMMQQLLTGRTRLPGFSAPWDEQAQLGDHFDITSSKRVFQHEWQASGVPFYRARELAVLGETGSVDNELFIDRELFNRYKRLHGAPSAGDFLVTGVGTLGKTYVVQPDDEFYFKDGNIIWLKPFGTVDTSFLKFLFESPLVQDQVQGESSGTTVGTYTITNAKRTRIPLPPLPEQQAIAAVFADVEAEVKVLRIQLAKVRAVKTGMMQQLLTGRTRLPIEEAA